jgi:peptide subunit release factor 1 (eRF1)
VVLRDEAETVNLLRDRVEQSHFAVSGFEMTLEQLQEGKIDTLVMARATERSGVCCLHCGFYLTASDAKCKYCGGAIEGGVDLVEAMIRMASEQEIDITFVDPKALTDLGDTGGILKF